MKHTIVTNSPLFHVFVQVCPLPPMVTHGDYICHPRPCERYNHGTVVEFYCDPGYTLTNDYKYITCQYGEWFPSYQVYCVKTGVSQSVSQCVPLSLICVVNRCSQGGAFTLIDAQAQSVLPLTFDFNSTVKNRLGVASKNLPAALPADNTPILLDKTTVAVNSSVNGCVLPESSKCTVAIDSLH
ncbi:hypothetical protein lerEdw1_018862 [Lerista edwardsae]|nr:hypothetical protein lerEdw1_018862 [Lerista edwardsae]